MRLAGHAKSSLDGSTSFESAETQAAVADIQAGLAGLPNVISTRDAVGAIASGPETAVMAGSISADRDLAVVSAPNAGVPFDSGGVQRGRVHR
jgi:hypothetical protein